MPVDPFADALNQIQAALKTASSASADALAAKDQQIADLTAANAQLKAQLTKLSPPPPVVIPPSDPPPVISVSSDLTSMANGLGDNETRVIPAGTYTMSGALIKKNNIKLICDPAAPATIITGATAIDLQGSNCEISNFIVQGTGLVIRLSGRNANIHDFRTPLFEGPVPPLQSFVVIEDGADGSVLSNNTMFCIKAAVFNQASNIIINNLVAKVRDEHGWRIDGATINGAKVVPVNVTINGGEFWNVVGQTKECCTARVVKKLTINGGKYHGPLRLGEESGSGNVDATIGGNILFDFAYAVTAKDQWSQLSCEAGVTLWIQDALFDLTHSPTTKLTTGQMKLLQQPLSVGDGSLVTVGPNVVRKTPAGLYVVKELIYLAKSSAKMAGVASQVIVAA